MITFSIKPSKFLMQKQVCIPLSLYICIYVYIYTYVYIYICIYIYIYICIYIHIHMHLYTYIELNLLSHLHMPRLAANTAAGCTYWRPHDSRHLRHLSKWSHVYVYMYIYIYIYINWVAEAFGTAVAAKARFVDEFGDPSHQYIKNNHNPGKSCSQATSTKRKFPWPNGRPSGFGKIYWSPKKWETH